MAFRLRFQTIDGGAVQTGEIFGIKFIQDGSKCCFFCSKILCLLMVNSQWFGSDALMKGIIIIIIIWFIWGAPNHQLTISWSL